MSTPALWTVRLGRAAERQLDRLPAHDRDAIRAALRALAHDPFGHPKAQRLHEHGFGWRLRVRDYRVLYDLDPLERLILVAQVLRRTSTTYRGRP
jgi:mRNA-degrading endonuclease RelE of RelBE toxin-antitoxin system